MPVTISGDGGISGLGGLDGYDLQTQTLVVSGDTTIAPQAAGRATLFCDDSVNSVGINTTTPAAAVFLEVADGTDPIVRVNNTGGGHLDIGSTTTFGYVQGSAGHALQLGSNGANTIALQGDGNINIDNNTVYINTSNNYIGINTGSPSNKLHVIDSSATGIRSQSVASQTTDTNKALHVSNGNLTDTFNVSYKGQGYFAGNVGIGTESPGRPLIVDGGTGNIIAAFQSTGTGCGFGLKDATTTADNFVTLRAIGDALVTHTGGTERVRILANGNVGIGTDSPTQGKLVVGGPPTTGLPAINVNQYNANFANTTDIQLSANSVLSSDSSINCNIVDGFFAIHGGGAANTGLDSTTEHFRINNSGNVGIGTASPTSALHVSTANSEQARFESTVSSYINVKSPAGQNLLGVEPNGAWVGPIESIPLVFKIANSESMRIDSSGRLLLAINTSRNVGTYPSKLQLEGVQNYTNSSISLVHNRTDSGGPQIRLGKSRGSTAGSNTLVAANDSLGFIRFYGADGTDLDSAAATIDCLVDGTPGVNDMPGRLVFSTTADGASSPTERMRISSTGNVQFNYTGSNLPGSGNTEVGALFERLSDGSTLFISRTNNIAGRFNRNSDGTLLDFRRSGSSVGSISVTTSATSYNTSSDYRLKENVVDLTGALDRVNQLQVRRFNFIVDPAVTVDGFIAHEAQDVVPECVTGTKDEVDDQGSPVYQSIDQSKLVPLLTAALQEALSAIEILKTKVAALEAAN